MNCAVLKRAIAVVSALILVIVCDVVIATASSPDTPEDHFTVSAVVGGVSVTGFSQEGIDAGLTVISIPAVMGGQPVVRIGNGAFSNKNLTSVTIPNGVTHIEVLALRGNNLVSITIPDSVTDIAMSAFAYNNLTSVTIPGSVTNIGAFAFEHNNLTSITIANGVTTIGQGAFAHNNLAAVTIPGSVTTVGNSAFNNNNLTAATIQNGVTTIGESAFALNNLTSVAIPGSVTTIGEHAFRMNSLSSLTIPSSVSTISEGAFADNPALANVIFDSPIPPASVGPDAFYNIAPGARVIRPPNTPSFGGVAVGGLWHGLIVFSVHTVEIDGITVFSRIYDGNPITYSGTPIFTNTVTNTTVDLIPVFTWHDSNGIVLATAPATVGNYTLTVSADGGEYYNVTDIVVSFEITSPEGGEQPDNGNGMPPEDEIPEIPYNGSDSAPPEDVAAAPPSHYVPQTGITGRIILPIVLGVLGVVLVATGQIYRIQRKKKGGDFR